MGARDGQCMYVPLTMVFRNAKICHLLHPQRYSWILIVMLG